MDDEDKQKSVGTRIGEAVAVGMAILGLIFITLLMLKGIIVTYGWVFR